MSTQHAATDPRARATEHFRIAATHVEAVFDAHDQLRDLLSRQSALFSEDPVAGAHHLLAHLDRIQAALVALRAAVAAALPYRSARELARDLGTNARFLSLAPEPLPLVSATATASAHSE